MDTFSRTGGARKGRTGLGGPTAAAAAEGLVPVTGSASRTTAVLTRATAGALTELVGRTSRAGRRTPTGALR